MRMGNLLDEFLHGVDNVLNRGFAADSVAGVSVSVSCDSHQRVSRALLRHFLGVSSMYYRTSRVDQCSLFAGVSGSPQLPRECTPDHCGSRAPHPELRGYQT